MVRDDGVVAAAIRAARYADAVMRRTATGGDMQSYWDWYSDSHPEGVHPNAIYDFAHWYRKHIDPTADRQQVYDFAKDDAFAKGIPQQFSNWGKPTIYRGEIVPNTGQWWNHDFSDPEHDELMGEWEDRIGSPDDQKSKGGIGIGIGPEGEAVTYRPLPISQPKGHNGEGFDPDENPTPFDPRIPLAGGEEGFDPDEDQDPFDPRIIGASRRHAVGENYGGSWHEEHYDENGDYVGPHWPQDMSHHLDGNPDQAPYSAGYHAARHPAFVNSEDPLGVAQSVWTNAGGDLTGSMDFSSFQDGWMDSVNGIPHMFLEPEAHRSYLESTGDSLRKFSPKRLRDHFDSVRNPTVPYTDPDENIAPFDPRIIGAGLHARLAANEELLQKLHDDFHDWYAEHGNERLNWAGRGPLGNWHQIENFLKDRYPAAHKGITTGKEEAGRLLDTGQLGPDGDYCPKCHGQGNHILRTNEACPACGGSGKPDQPMAYATGQDAIDRFGYDPKEIAAGMLLLHNRTHSVRSDLEQGDNDRLSEIARMRSQMMRGGALDFADIIRLAGDGMSWEDTMNYIDQTLAEGQPEDTSDYSTDYYEEPLPPGAEALQCNHCKGYARNAYEVNHVSVGDDYKGTFCNNCLRDLMPSWYGHTARLAGLDMADIVRLAGDGMSYEDTMRYIDQALQEGESDDNSNTLRVGHEYEPHPQGQDFCTSESEDGELCGLPPSAHPDFDYQRQLMVDPSLINQGRGPVYRARKSHQELLAMIDKMAGDGMSWEDTMAHIDQVLAEGEQTPVRKMRTAPEGFRPQPPQFPDDGEFDYLSDEAEAQRIRDWDDQRDG